MEQILLYVEKWVKEDLLKFLENSIKLLLILKDTHPQVGRLHLRETIARPVYLHWFLGQIWLVGCLIRLHDSLAGTRTQVTKALFSPCCSGFKTE